MALDTSPSYPKCRDATYDSTATTFFSTALYATVSCDVVPHHWSANLEAYAGRHPVQVYDSPGSVQPC
jgi:hypothetical protein